MAVSSEWLVDSVDAVSESGRIKKEWVGLILIPIVGNAAEHATAVTVSLKNKITLSIGVAVGSSIVSSLPSEAGPLSLVKTDRGISKLRF